MNPNSSVGAVLIIRSLLASNQFDGVELAARAISLETGREVSECRSEVRAIVLRSIAQKGGAR